MSALMDTMGSLELRWAKGYCGERAEFINQDVMCFKCGSSVMFLNSDGQETVYCPSDQAGVGQLAVHSINGLFAFSERTIDPNINIVQFPSLLTINTLVDGAELEYISLTFSTSDYLASISGIPDYKLTIWNYMDGTKLIVHDLPHVAPSWVAFNPANWRQLALSTTKQLTVWTVEQNNDQFVLTKQKFKMPVRPADPNASGASTGFNPVVDSHDVVQLPLSTIAGLRGPEAEVFEEYRDDVQRVVPASHCWTPSGDIIVGCSSGELLRIDNESNTVSILVCHVKSVGQSPDVSAHNVKKNPSGLSTGGDPLGKRPSSGTSLAVGDVGIKQPSSGTNLTGEPGSGKPSRPGSRTGLSPREHETDKKTSSATALAVDAEATGTKRPGSATSLAVDGMPPGVNAVPRSVSSRPPSAHRLSGGHLQGSPRGSGPSIVSELVAKGGMTPFCTEQCTPIVGPTGGLFSYVALHKRALFVGGSDGTLLQVQLSGNHALIVASHQLSCPITSLSFNPSHHRLAIGSSKGRMYLCDPETDMETSPHCVFDIDCGNFVAVRSLASSSDYCVTLRQSGQLQVWKTENGRCVSGFNIGEQASALGSSPLTNIVMVGSVTGKVYVVDLTTIEQPRIVAMDRLHHEPVRHVVFTLNGSLALTASSDGSLFVIDGRPSRKFHILGHVGVLGRVLGLATYSTAAEDSSVYVVATCCQEKDESNAASKLYSFHLPPEVLSNATGLHASAKCDFRNDLLRLLIFNFSEPTFGLTLSMDNTIFAISKVTKMIHKIQVPQDAPKKEKSKDSFLVVLEKLEGHQLPGGVIHLSPHHKWLASGGGDGRILVRLMTSANHLEAVVGAHNFWTGGVLDFVFSPDGQFVWSAGYDGTLSCFRWQFNPSGEEEGKLAVQTCQTLVNLLHRTKYLEEEAIHTMPTWVEYTDVSPGDLHIDKRDEIDRQIEAAIAKDQIFEQAIPEPPKTATWLDVKAYEAMTEEDKAYASMKREIREEIREMRRKLQKMMEVNEAQQQIEKLPRHEFDLDVEEQRQLSAQCEIEVQKLREEKEFENLAKMYLTDVIRRECWDDMMVKGRGLVAFNSSLEVYNFPLKDRTQDELEQLDIVKTRRKIEIAELAARKEIVDTVLVNRQRALLAEEETVDSDSQEDSTREKSTLMGSLADIVGGAADLYYSQFELCSREQKMNQIVLLQDTIYRIKIQYNKDFDEVFVKKENEIAKIRERNRRIGKILQDLDINDPLYHPEMGPIEKPEMLLVTTDDEVKVEKFLTPEQWKKMEEDRKTEEERRMREKGDNWRERGLDQMMGGVLEIKKEDELKKDIPIPQFMQEKPEEQFTDEERKAVADYERKVKELEEEREKFRKQLELELRKLQAMVLEGTTNFDETLNQLFMKKVKSELTIYQEELKMLRLRYSILQEEEMAYRERELIELIDAKKRESQAMVAEVSAAKKQMDEYRTDYEMLVADDKTLDKGFRREFPDVSNMMADQLYKHFRKRPRGQKARMLDAAYEASSSNPFADRPSTARKNDEAQKALDAAMQELDHTMPENITVDPLVWERLCQYRREKINCENTIKQKALVLAEMQAFVQHRHEEDERLKNEIDELAESLNKLRADRQIFFSDLEIQLLLKQGQVEVDPGQFIPDYRNSLLVHRSVVEDLNRQVKLLSDSKIASMVESKDFRKGIVQLEWEHKKMTMEMEDLQNRMRDIVSMKVTREIQAYLSDADYDSRKAQEISALEQTIQAQKQQHEKTVTERKRTVKQIKRTIEEMMTKNDALMRELEALNVAVNERRHIHDISGDKSSESDRVEHYREIVQRRRLVDLAKAQSQEVAVLRAEVERLRMRTFAALVQVEH